MGMTKEQVQRDYGGIQKRHRGEIAQAVRGYCEDNRMAEIADWLGFSEKWVKSQLDHAGLNEALGGGNDFLPLTGSTDNVAKEIPKLIKEYGPTEAEQKSEEFEPYLEHYQSQGHNDAAATRLAKAEWAGEAAVEAGVIKESRNSRNEKVNKITFPEHDEDKLSKNCRTSQRDSEGRYFSRCLESSPALIGHWRAAWDFVFLRFAFPSPAKLQSRVLLLDGVFAKNSPIK